MKIKLTQDHSIRGRIEKADTIVEVHDGVADDLIKRGIADTYPILSRPKADKPKADK
jgi:hypothetical protein